MCVCVCVCGYECLPVEAALDNERLAAKAIVRQVQVNIYMHIYVLTYVQAYINMSVYT